MPYNLADRESNHLVTQTFQAVVHLSLQMYSHSVLVHLYSLQDMIVSGFSSWKLNGAIQTDYPSLCIYLSTSMCGRSVPFHPSPCGGLWLASYPTLWTYGPCRAANKFPMVIHCVIVLLKKKISNKNGHPFGISNKCMMSYWSPFLI